MAKNWRDSREYRIWRAHVIRRDSVCQICGSMKNRVAHHLNSASYFPEERYDENNGVTLCEKCHINFHNNFKKSYREKCTKYDFENFLTLCRYLKSVFQKEKDDKQ